MKEESIGAIWKVTVTMEIRERSKGLRREDSFVVTLYQDDQGQGIEL